MKKGFKMLFASLAVFLGMGAAGVAGMTAVKEADANTVEAATTSVTLAGSFNSWNTTSDPLTLSGDYWTISKEFAANDEFKIVVNGSDWVGDGDGVSWCAGMGSVGKGDNFKVLTAGKYTIKAVKTIGDYGDKSYGISFELFPFSTTLSVTFTSSVPEYVDIYIPGTFNSWSADSAVSKMTRSSATVYTYPLTDVVAGDYQYKLVAVYSGAAMDYDHQITTSNQTVSLLYSDNGKTKSLGSKTYDFASNFPVYSPTLTVTFTTDVPDYVDIYIPGEFNSWSSSKAVSKMTRSNSTTFTYSLTNVQPKAYNYKIVACYASATEMDYAHEIDTSNKSVTISSGSAVSLGSRTYDFATNMPQETIPTGTTVTLTFASTVPSTVNIIFVGSLTNWGTTAARLEAGTMSANAARTVFTWNVPNGTYTGSYEYKIVAMSMYSGETTANYTDIVYGNKDTNETLTLNKTTTNYPLTANVYDLSILGAIGYAQYFNQETGTICSTGSTSADHSSALGNIWTTLKNRFEGMPSGAKTAFCENDYGDVVDARARYIHIVGRYSTLTPFTNGPAASLRFSPMIAISSDSSMIVVAIFAVILTGAGVGGYFLLRKKRVHH